MKKILASILLLLSFSVFAKDIAYVSNSGGGRIVFTDEVCRLQSGKIVEGLHRMYNYGRSGSTQYGCYYMDMSSAVLKAIWDDGDQYVYPVNRLVFFN